MNNDDRPKCEYCTVAKYCDTMISSIKLCREVSKKYSKN